jgi:hypothetical protein
MRAQYSTNGSTWATLTSNSISLTSGTVQGTAYESVPAGARGVVQVRAFGFNGNGASDPAVNGIALQCKA